MRPILYAAALAAPIFAAAPTSAQIAPEDVWAEMREGIERSQATIVSVDETREGDTLALREITVEMEDQFSVTTLVIPEVVLRQGAEGVSIELPERSEIAVSVENEWSEQPSTGSFALTQAGLVATVTGESTEDYGYDYVADTFGFEILEITDNSGEGFPGSFSMTMTGLEGAYAKVPAGDGLERIVQTGSIARLEATMNLEESDPDTLVDFSLSLADLAIETEVTLAPDLEPENFLEALDAGLAGSGTGTIGETSYGFVFREGPYFEGGTVNEVDFRGASAGANVSFSMGNDGIRYEGAAEGIVATVETSEMPIGPVTANLERVGIDLVLPVRQGEAPQDYAYGFAYEGLTLSDNVWDMLPMMTGAEVDLPRDPITIRLGMSGQASLPFELFDPEVYAGGTPPPPPMPTTLSLDDLLISGVGVELSGTGAIEFDQDDLETWGGVPAPSGTVNLSLDGLQGLVQTLVQAGLVPPEQALFAQGMIGAVARPVGEDAYESEIVFGPGAQITANGFPVPLPQ